MQLSVEDGVGDGHLRLRCRPGDPERLAVRAGLVRVIAGIPGAGGVGARVDRQPRILVAPSTRTAPARRRSRCVVDGRGGEHRAVVVTGCGRGGLRVAVVDGARRGRHRRRGGRLAPDRRDQHDSVAAAESVIARPTDGVRARRHGAPAAGAAAATTTADHASAAAAATLQAAAAATAATALGDAARAAAVAALRADRRAAVRPEPATAAVANAVATAAAAFAVAAEAAGTERSVTA